MKHLSITLLFLAGFLLQSHAQLTVADDNNVGIGESAPISKLAVNATGSTYSTLFVENSTASHSQRAAKFYKSSNGGTWSYGIISHILLNGSSRLVGGLFAAYNSTPLSSYRAIGMYSYAGNATDGYNYGVWARLYGSQNGAALFATTGTDYEIDTEGEYAGYFRGDVLMEDNLEVEGTLYETSDINLKKDIRPLSDEETSQTDKLKTLSAIKYKLKNPAELNDFKQEILDTMKVDPRTIEYTDEKYTEDRIGLSAQEVQLVYPELVKEKNNGYLSMNYIGLIPVLVDALNEQDETFSILDEAIKLQDETNKAQDDAIKLHEDAIQALIVTVQAQVATIEVLKADIEKLKNPETTE